MSRKKLTLEQLMDDHGRLKFFPIQEKLRKEAIEYIASRFYPGIEYFEHEVEDIIEATHLFDEVTFLKEELLRSALLKIDRYKKSYFKASA